MGEAVFEKTKQNKTQVPNRCIRMSKPGAISPNKMGSERPRTPLCYKIAYMKPKLDFC